MSGEVTTTNGTNLVEIDEELLRMGGAGTENIKSKDVLIPRLVILQGLSPQLNKKKAEYIDGAEVGDFCNVATGDIFKEEIIVIPCHWATAYIEWVKGRAGIANNFGDNPDVLKGTSKNDKFQNILPNGNEIQENAQWYCLLKNGANWERIFFPLKATMLKHSRKWATLTQAENLQTSAGFWKPPLFWRSWKLSIVDESNDQGDWATFRPEKGEETIKLDPSKQLLRQCMKFYEDIRTNVVRPDTETEADDAHRAAGAKDVTDEKVAM